MKISNNFSISNGIHSYNVENVGRNDGCPFCANEKCNLFFIWSDELGDFSDICGDNYICKKCLPDILKKHDYEIV
jgi:hypothetical protein